MAKRYVAVAMAVWMIWAALAGLSAQAAPAHIIGGGLYGPGGSVLPGPTNAANAAGFVFYSTNQPTYAVLVGTDPGGFTPADGTNPALWAKDVGSSWNWVDGDVAVAVAETIRGVNGWTGVNSTSSIDGILRVGGTVQDFGNGTLEAQPALSLAAGVDYVVVSWSGLADANGNVASYRVYHSASRTGPWTGLANVNQGASLTYNATGLASGQNCFTLATNFRGNTAMTGSVYETVGRSEVQCTNVVGLPPRVTGFSPTTPAALTAPIVITFSEGIVPGSFSYTIVPNIAMAAPSWNGPTNTIVTINHLPAVDFTQCTPYTVTVTNARDVDNNPLQPPNAFQFTTTCPNPYITQTSPANGATQVLRSRPIVITFSKDMSSATVTLSGAFTGSTGCNWNPANVCTLGATLITPGATYTAEVTAATDTLGNPLVPGPAPNPWTFTTNNPPNAQLTQPTTSECRTGGSSVTIAWTMSDTETAVASLRVWLNWTLGSTNPIAGMQDRTGLTGSETFGWTAPAATDGTIVLSLDVLDGAGEKGSSLIDLVIDSTAPYLASSVPADGAASVPTDAVFTLTFSEAMNHAATEGAITFAPTPLTGLAFGWNGNAVTIWHNSTSLAPTTGYTLTVGSAAVDDCNPGLSIDPARNSIAFTTGSGARAPNPPTALTQDSVTTSAVTFHWTAPTTYNDNTPLTVSAYHVYRASTATGTGALLGTVTGTSYTDSSVSAGTTYYYYVTAEDGAGLLSADSARLQVTTPAPPPTGLDPLVILIPIIVILVLIGLFLLLRKKKPAAAPPSGAARAPPKESAPEEGGTGPEPEAKGEEKFIPCPNCGTMVKPTDAECFVCGAKL